MCFTLHYVYLSQAKAKLVFSPSSSSSVLIVTHHYYPSRVIVPTTSFPSVDKWWFGWDFETQTWCGLIVFLRRCRVPPPRTVPPRLQWALHWYSYSSSWSPLISQSARHLACVRCVHYVMNGSCKNICPVLPKSAHLWSAHHDWVGRGQRRGRGGMGWLWRMLGCYHKNVLI